MPDAVALLLSLFSLIHPAMIDAGSDSAFCYGMIAFVIIFLVLIVVIGVKAADRIEPFYFNHTPDFYRPHRYVEPAYRTRPKTIYSSRRILDEDPALKAKERILRRKIEEAFDRYSEFGDVEDLR